MPPGSWGVGGMIIGCLKAVGGGMELVSSMGVVVSGGTTVVGEFLTMCGVLADGGDTSPSAVVLVLAPRSYTVSCHSHFSHGQIQPSFCHGHLLVSAYSFSARTPSTKIVAHRNPIIAFVSCCGRGIDPGCCHSASPMEMPRAKEP